MIHSDWVSYSLSVFQYIAISGTVVLVANFHEFINMDISLSM